MIENLIDVEVMEYGAGFGRRFLVHHTGGGFFRCVELETSRREKGGSDEIDVIEMQLG